MPVVFKALPCMLLKYRTCLASTLHTCRHPDFHEWITVNVSLMPEGFAAEVRAGGFLAPETCVWGGVFIACHISCLGWSVCSRQGRRSAWGTVQTVTG